MQRKSENPFQAHPDWHHNACISNPGKPMSGKPMVATVPPRFIVRLEAMGSDANRPSAFNKAKSLAVST